ncbi:ABC transporter permease [Carboxydochorda subterranea]|uniref:ABC transporter permease n=1 Tax=Carboxydichorda subterranea TaxID=3109565 RepID=A0ABZ1BWY1_9FIRM|nr:ABC transporter permease [Limnochorda sp. L945t]WRP17183.1 ABC transporter permease [Limnochorda sp. L945t]
MTSVSEAPAGTSLRYRWRLRPASYGTFLGFLLILALFSALRPDAFLSPTNLRNILEQVAILAVITATMTIVMVAGDFDLSVGSLASLAGVTTASLLVRGVGVLPAVAAGFLLGAAAGALNGLLVAYLGLSAFVTTLATMTAFRGLALWYTDGSTIFGLPDAFLGLGQGTVGPVPAPVIVMALAMAAVWVVLAQTTTGRRWYAVGGNPEAAYLSGVNVQRLRFGAFVLSGIGAAVAGVVLTSRLASAHPLAGEPFMLTSIAAVFLGMTMFKDGQPNVPGSLVGVLILGVLSNGLNILQVNTYIQDVLTGLIIVAAVLVSRLAGTGGRRS